MKGTRFAAAGVILAGMVLCCCPLFAGTYRGGAGTAADPYRISTVADWQELMATVGDWDKHFILTADLDLAEISLVPVGTSSQPFTGVFDGNGHIIRNAVIDQPSSDYVGLFGYLGSDSQIRNLGVENVNITGRYYVGGLVGWNDSGTLTSCHAAGSVTGDYYVGGLVGYNYGTLTSCYATGSVSGAGSYVGGLVGQNSGALTCCYATGSVSGGRYVGGLVGGNDYGTLTACYATGSVSGTDEYGSVGGLVGGNGGTLTSCYATGSVSGTDRIGGLVGRNYGTLTSCFWDVETSAMAVGVGSGTSTGVTGKTTAEMKTRSTFTDAGWDFDGINGDPPIWSLANDGLQYPVLTWQLTYHGGIGTMLNPYQIMTFEELVLLSNTPEDWDKFFILLADIDMSNMSLEHALIAPDTDNLDGGFQGTPFTGGFDGNGHTISNLTITASTQDYVGLFGYHGSGSEIRNLGVENVNITGRNYVGGLVGRNDSGMITSCYATGSVSGTVSYVGGLVGLNYGTLTSCYATGSVGGYSEVGGLVGWNYYSGTLTSCYATGTVSGTGYYVGGLVGENDYGTLITSCYATGSVTGTGNYVGGLVGGNRGTITSCYATGSVGGSSYVGGLVGYNYNGTLTSCYATGSVGGTGYSVGGLVGGNSGTLTSCFWDVETSGQSVGSDISTGVTGKTTAQMQDIQTFLDEGWDFVGESVNGTADVWRMCVDGVSYPRLSWEFSWGGDFGCPDGVRVEDLVYLCERWLAAGPGAAGAADANGDGKVDLADYAILAEHWLMGERLPEDLVSIPGGTFQMGDSIGDGGSDQRPVHTVTLDSFDMGRYEVTNGQYCTFLNSAYPSQLKVVNGIVYASGDTANSFPYCDTSTFSSYSQIAFSNDTFSVRTKGARDMSNDPMVCVSWYGSVAYCNWRSQKEGREECYNLSTWNCDFTKKGYRLATEAEWEYAARGGLSGKRFPWGDTITHSQANYWSYSGYSYDISPTRGRHPAWDDDGIYPYTSPVGSFPANGYGLCDMAGNVWEWCNDWYGGYSAGSQNSPTGPTTGTGRVIRGGAWDFLAPHCAVTYRYYGTPSSRNYYGGFRLLLDLNYEDLVPIPGGTFQMGDSIGDGGLDQRPVHTVTLDSFAMGKYEITNGQYCAYLNSALQQGLITVSSGVVYKSGSGTSFPYCDTSTSPSGMYSQIAFSNNTFSVRTKGVRDMSNDPMVKVSWYGAAAYCNWRGQQEGKQICYNLSTWNCDFTKKGYRLATEAEWEYAARGGLAGKRFPWGDTITHSQANYYSYTDYSYDISLTRGYHPAWDDDGIWPYTSPVGSFAANGYGLYDMAGNVFEWCNDWYGGYSAGSQNSPTGPTTGLYRVLRSGGFYNVATYCAVTGRYYVTPSHRSDNVGFRLVLDLNYEDLVSIPAGSFQMGDSIGDGGSDQRPVHTVTLDSFTMGKYEITNGQYCTFLNSAYPSQLKVVNGIVYASGDAANSFPYCDTSSYNSGSQIAFLNNTFSVRTKGARDMSNDPMVQVSWYGSVAYCNWRSRHEGREECYNLSLWTCDFTKKGYRLATEAEWEYAARGGLSGKRFPWGDTITHSQANYTSSTNYGYDISPTRGRHPAWDDDGIYPYTSPVGSFPANGYGLCDMAGNVWEWCNDWYGGYSAGSQNSPTGPTTGASRVLRGGGWYGDATYCAVTYRDGGSALANRHFNVGFRLLLDLN